ncbi:hypothetical protein, partial [Burkholderia ubonensis]|uniref:hypothetical protein n=1 Tax=Burkholderia ubonensis TaxID=101571 RepID=UPI000A961E47
FWEFAAHPTPGNPLQCLVPLCFACPTTENHETVIKSYFEALVAATKNGWIDEGEYLKSMTSLLNRHVIGNIKSRPNNAIKLCLDSMANAHNMKLITKDQYFNILTQKTFQEEGNEEDCQSLSIMGSIIENGDEQCLGDYFDALRAALNNGIISRDQFFELIAANWKGGLNEIKFCFARWKSIETYLQHVEQAVNSNDIDRDKFVELIASSCADHAYRDYVIRTIEMISRDRDYRLPKLVNGLDQYIDNILNRGLIDSREYGYLMDIKANRKRPASERATSTVAAGVDDRRRSGRRCSVQ